MSISVKLFKMTHRWRPSFSNNSIEVKKIDISKNKLDNQSVLIKKLTLITNRDYNNDLPVVLILRTNRKTKLIHVLSEGLSSYGYNILNLKLKFVPCAGCDILDESIKNELKYIISTTINSLSKRNLLNNTNYYLLTYSKSSFSYIPMISDNKNIRLILINPILNKLGKRNITEVFKKPEMFSS